MLYATLIEPFMINMAKLCLSFMKSRGSNVTCLIIFSVAFPY